MASLFTRLFLASAPSKQIERSFCEPLEERRFFAVGPECPQVPPDSPASDQLVAPLGATAAPSLIGKYRGKVTVTGTSLKLRLRLTIARQTDEGRLKGSISSPDIGSTKFSAKGTIRPDGTFTVKFGKRTLGVTGTIDGARRPRDGALRGDFVMHLTLNNLPPTVTGQFALKKTA